MSRADESGYVFRDNAPERAGVYRRLEGAAHRARAAPAAQFDLPYGPHPAERLDMFPGPAGASLVVFFHGGYWQSHDKARYSGIALALNERGLSAAVVGYPLAPKVRVEQIVASARASVCPALSLLAGFSGAPKRWIAVGHSAGAHLACHALREASNSPTPLAGAVLLSGIFDLRPLVGTSLNRALRLTRAKAAQLSPSLTPPSAPAFGIFAGDAETIELRAQSIGFLDVLSTLPTDARLELLPGRTHYSILEELLDAQSSVMDAISALAVPTAKALT